MKQYLIISALLFAFLLTSSAWAMGIPPDELVDQTVQEVIDIIKQDDDIQAGNTDKVLDLVENKILPHFNFSRMTRLALGKNWNKVGAEQQDELVEQFRTLLVRSYSATVSRYRDETVVVKSLDALGDAADVTVNTQVIQGRGKQPVPIDYRMEKKDDGWKIYDVTVSGVSLVTNYRGSFNSQIRKGGVEGLIKSLQDKNRSLEGK